MGGASPPPGKHPSGTFMNSNYLVTGPKFFLIGKKTKIHILHSTGEGLGQANDYV